MEQLHSISVYQNLKRVIQSLGSMTTLEQFLTSFLSCYYYGHRRSKDGGKARISVRCYLDVCSDILDLSKSSWWSEGQDMVHRELNEVICQGPGKDILWLLAAKLSDTHSVLLREIMRLIENIVGSLKMSEILWQECQVVSSGEGTEKYLSDMVCDESLVSLIVSFPDRISNKLVLDRDSLLLPNQYYTRLTECLCDTLTRVHDSLACGKDCSMIFISRLFAKMCTLKHGSKLYDILIPKFHYWTSISPLWTRICCYFFIKCPDPTLEDITEPLLRREIQPMLLSALLDNGIHSNPKLRYLLSHKYLLIRSYDDDNVPRNIVSYLSGKEDRTNVLLDAFYKLLTVWGDKLSLNSISFDQHYYISRCLSIAVWGLREEKLQKERGKVLKLVMRGVASHLESPSEKIRCIGMTMAEIISKKMEDGRSDLKFDFVKDDNCLHLVKLHQNPHECAQWLGNKLSEKENYAKSTRVDGSIPEPMNSRERSEDHCTNFDSDDEFEPYDFDDASDDETVNGVRPPVYVRDCLNGILSRDDANRLESSLRVFSKLIWSEKGDLSYLAVEIAKVLLYLDDQYRLANFNTLRFDAMVAICCKYPKLITGYLTKEFYAENYNVRQRLDILDVLSTSASLLSKPNGITLPSEPRLQLPKIHLTNPAENTTDWKAIVEKRIKAKTKIISKGKIKEEDPSSNKLATVAGDFFFPLLRYLDSSNLTFDLLGQDCFLLGRLIYCAGSIMNSATGLQVAHQMASVAFDVIWSLRYHQEAFVRQSVIHLACIIFISCNPERLVSDFGKEIIDTKEWVEDVMRNDADKECHQLSIHCVALMQSTVKAVLSKN